MAPKYFPFRWISIFRFMTDEELYHCSIYPPDPCQQCLRRYHKQFFFHLFAILTCIFLNILPKEANELKARWGEGLLRSVTYVFSIIWRAQFTFSTSMRSRLYGNLSTTENYHNYEHQPLSNHQLLSSFLVMFISSPWKLSPFTIQTCIINAEILCCYFHINIRTVTGQSA